MKILEYLRNRKILTIVLLISFTFFGLISVNAIGGNSLNIEKNSVNPSNAESVYASSPVTINVLIYDGDGVIPDSVDGIEDCLDYANSENIAPNVHFNYSTTEEINSQTLSGYDVLIMPGGLASTYLEDPNIDVDDLKNFVYSGKGYLGICAGSYVASNHVDGYYDGWGIAPHINAKSVDYVGELPISFTLSGTNVLNSSNVETLYHWNGPAMYETDGSNASYMAEYFDNETGYQNYAAIANDTYGSGRVILSGPHPELNPQKPEMLVRMILWTTKKI